MFIKVTSTKSYRSRQLCVFDLEISHYLFQFSGDREEHEHELSLTNTSATIVKSNLEFASSAESDCRQCDFIRNSRTATEEHIVKNHSECTKCISNL